jgi:hypothetical protein
MQSHPQSRKLHCGCQPRTLPRTTTSRAEIFASTCASRVTVTLPPARLIAPSTFPSMYNQSEQITSPLTWRLLAIVAGPAAVGSAGEVREGLTDDSGLRQTKEEEVFSSPRKWSTRLCSISRSFLHLSIGVCGLYLCFSVNLPGSLPQPLDGLKLLRWATGLGPLRRFGLAYGWNVWPVITDHPGVDPRGMLPRRLPPPVRVWR